MAYRGSKWNYMPVADRRKRVADLHAKGLANGLIARRLGIADTTVSQDLLALGLRTRGPGRSVAKLLPAEVPPVSLADITAVLNGVSVDELLTPHGLGKLRLIEIQALYVDGLTTGERAALSAKTIGFTLAELSRDQLIAAVLRQREKTPGPAYPRVPGTGSVPARPPAGTPAGAGGEAGAAARPEPAQKAS